MEKIMGKIKNYKIYFALLSLSLSHIIFVKNFICLLNILLFLYESTNSLKNTSGIFIFSRNIL